jgi:hypothetical protein
MNISPDKIFEDIAQSARDSHSAKFIAEQLLDRFDKFENRFEANNKKLEGAIRDEVLGVKASILQDRDRYFEKKDKPVLEALEKLATKEALEKLAAKFDGMNDWRIETDSDIKKAKWGIRTIIVAILGYFGISIKI